MYATTIVRPPILRDFPESFETERLLIRGPLPGDGPEVHAAVNESLDELLPWMDWPRQHETVEDSEEKVRRDRARFLERTDLLLLLFLKGTDTLVGGSGLHRMDWSVPRFEIGYWCRTRFAGSGYITEAVRAITSFALEHLGARRVEIRCDSLNERSIRVAERAGYRLEGELRNAEVGAGGGPRNVLVFSVIPEDRAPECLPASDKKRRNRVSSKRRITKFFDMPSVVPPQGDALAPRYNAGYTPEHEECDLDT